MANLSAVPEPLEAKSPQSKLPQSKSADSPEECAVILTSFKILRHGSARSDATPSDYARNGLRTSGTWTGSGQSLDSISLTTGHTIRSTQSSSQSLDYAITSTTTGSRLTYKGKIETESQITLLP